MRADAINGVGSRYCIKILTTNNDNQTSDERNRSPSTCAP